MIKQLRALLSKVSSLRLTPRGSPKVAARPNAARADTPYPDEIRGPVMNLSREQFREWLIEALEDPATARLVARRLLLPVFPTQGGVCAGPSADDITSGDFGSNCSDAGNYTFAGGGKVGIGTTTPAYKLDVVGGSARVTNPSGTTQLQVTGSATSGRLGQDAAGFFLSSDTNGASVRFLTNNGSLNEWMRITSAGKVGIGTAAPSHVLDIKAQSAVGAANFTGSGLNDMASGGTFLGASALTYKVQIDGAGTPDTFKWSDNGGATWNATAVPITGGAQTLDNGVTVTFTHTTGHTSGDYWTFSTTVTNPFSVQNAAGTRTLIAGNDGSLVLGGTATKQSSGGPELISAQNGAQSHVVLANWCLSDTTTNARFLLDIEGNHEWAGANEVGQSILLGFDLDGVLGLYGDPPNGGGLNVVAWKHSTLHYDVNSTTTTFTVYDGTQFATGTARVDNEIVDITAINGDTLTVTRGLWGTTAVMHSAGAYVTQSGTPEYYARVRIQTAHTVGTQDAGCQISFGSGAAPADTSITRLAGGGLSITGGNVGIGTTSPATSALLELTSTTGALLVPRMTTTERNALTAVNGMIIYNTTTNQMEAYVNGAWTAI